MLKSCKQKKGCTVTAHQKKQDAFSCTLKHPKLNPFCLMSIFFVFNNLLVSCKKEEKGHNGRTHLTYKKKTVEAKKNIENILPSLDKTQK